MTNKHYLLFKNKRTKEIISFQPRISEESEAEIRAAIKKFNAVVGHPYIYELVTNKKMKKVIDLKTYSQREIQLEIRGVKDHIVGLQKSIERYLEDFNPLEENRLELMKKSTGSSKPKRVRGIRSNKPEED